MSYRKSFHSSARGMSALRGAGKGRKSRRGGYRRGYHPNSFRTRFKRRGRHGSYHHSNKPQFVRVSRGGIRL